MLDVTDIGISTGAYRELSLGAALLRIAELSQFAEICSWGAHTLLEPVNQRTVAASGLPFTVHGPFTHAHFATASAARHREALELHRRHIEAAGELGAHLYVVHPDLSPHPRPWNKKVVLQLQRTFEYLRGLQEEYHVEVAVENMPFSRRSHLTAPGELDLRGLNLVLDVGHAMLAGTLTRFVNDHNGELRHLHLHDNEGHGSGDQHLALGDGVVDFEPALREARRTGATIVLEHLREKDVLTSLRVLEARGLLAPEGTASTL